MVFFGFTCALVHLVIEYARAPAYLHPRDVARLWSTGGSCSDQATDEHSGAYTDHCLGDASRISPRSICTVFTTSFLDSMSKMALEAMAYEDAVLPRVPEPTEPLAAAWSNLSRW